MLPRAAFFTEFIGRRDEVNAVLAAVDRHALVTVVGAGGLGKTRVAYQVIEALEADYEKRIWTVDLADLRDPALVGHVLSLAVEAPSPGEVFEPATLVAAIGADPAVILLDNCEHLLGACAVVVTALLRGCRGLRVLTTSRQPLGVIGEHVYSLPTLAPRDAVALFRVRADAAAPGWAPSEVQRSEVDAICTALEGMPLAIELVAAQVRMFSPRQLRRQLAEHTGALAVARGESTRQTSLESSIRWSHDLCTEAEKLLWQRLSVFAGGFSLDDVVETCAGEGLATEDVLGALGGLIDKSVVLRGDDERYRMLELIRQFGLARLRESDEVDVWRRRHLDHYVALARRFECEWWGPDQALWMKRLYLERRNLAVAFDFGSSSAENAPTVFAMSAVLEHFFAATGGGGAALRWLHGAVEFGVPEDATAANALRVGSFIANLVGEMESSAAFYAELLRIADSTGDPRILGFARYAESQLRTYQNDVEAGIEAAHEGLRLLQEVGDVGLEANLHFLYGVILGWADRPEAAAFEYGRCMALLAPRGERWLTSYSQWGLGVDALSTGSVEESITLEQQALRTKVDFGDQLGIGLTLEALAWASVEQRRARQAAFLLGGASAVWDRIGMSVAAMPYLSRRREAAVATCRAQLSTREYDELVESGRRLPQAHVVAVALGEARAPEPSEGYALTRREGEIAALIAAGRSNRAIADELVVSVRTVETHVENVLRKIGVSSRTEVAAALARIEQPAADS